MRGGQREERGARGGQREERGGQREERGGRGGQKEEGVQVREGRRDSDSLPSYHTHTHQTAQAQH